MYIVHVYVHVHVHVHVHVRTPLCAKWCAQQVYGGIHVHCAIDIMYTYVCATMVSYRYMYTYVTADTYVAGIKREAQGHTAPEG